MFCASSALATGSWGASSISDGQVATFSFGGNDAGTVQPALSVSGGEVAFTAIVSGSAVNVVLSVVRAPGSDNPSAETNRIACATITATFAYPVTCIVPSGYVLDAAIVDDGSLGGSITVQSAKMRYGMGGGGGGSGGGGGGSGGGSSANITVNFDCRSFGQTVAVVEGTPGTLNIKYATPMMCWATASTVSGVNVNDAGWVPEVWFDWNWDDNSLGTVSRGGLTVDLGVSVGLVAAHAFRPSTYAESCNGGTNSSHTVRLTVSSVVGGLRESDSATLTVCVEDPATTWPNPVAYCDDADCSNDSFTGVVNPGTPTHGGNGTDLATILNNCDSTSNRLLVEGGVTFSTGSTGITVGAQSCLVESYGGSKARLKFTSTSTSSSAISANACAGYRLHNLTLVGSGSGPRVITAQANTGCFVFLDADASATVGEEFSSMSTVDPSPSLMSEGYYFLSDYTTHTGGNNSFFIYGRYMAFVGSDIGATGEHIIRLPQWDHIVIDAMYLHNQQPGKDLLALRQDCGGPSSCPNSAFASVLAVTRNQMLSTVAGASPIQFCAPGSGTAEPTKCYDGDFIRNLMAYEGDTGLDWFMEFPTTVAGHEVKRMRFIQNAMSGDALHGSVARIFHAGVGAYNNFAAIGNVIVNTTQNGSTSYGIASGSTVWDVVKNNVCYENKATTCDIFPSFSESADNQSETADPFDGAAGQPGAYAALVWPDMLITSGNVALKGQGVITAYPADIEGESIPQSSDYDAGVDDE